jgi:superfamily II DNA or RNA helicase
MESLFGYLYVRVNEMCNIYNACKFGKVRIGNCPINRFQSYITYEIKQGEVVLLIKTTENVDLLESSLKDYFISIGSHIHFENGGTEYFSKDIIQQIIPKLQEMNIKFHVCSKEEIDEINQTVYPKKDDLTFTKPIPKDYQIEALDTMSKHYDKYNIGKIYWSCGLGKTMLSLFFVKEMRFKNVIIGVPSMNLQKQFKDEILKIFPNENNILCVGSIQTTNSKKIRDFLENQSFECKFLITTYHSCNLLLSLPEVDLKIGDESHHLVGKMRSYDKNFLIFHQIKSSRTLFMTATEKIIEEKEEPSLYSMDNEEIFGKVVDLKSVKWAIENKKITDFQVIIIKNKEEDFNSIVEKFQLSGESVEKQNVHLLISAYMTLKSLETIQKITHILIYTNTIDNAKLVNKYIDLLFETGLTSISKADLYNSALYSNCGKDIKTELDIFRGSRFGIISCVYLFGEGFDEPKLNGVCFADKMESDIRITQYALRPNRLEKSNDSKIAFVIIPYIDFEKLTIIISKLRKMDDTIQSKMRLFEINSNGSKNPRPTNPLPEIMNENMDELEKLKIKLRHSKALSSYFSEIEDEYEYIRIVNNELNIQSKEEYIQRKDDHESYIENPVVHFNGIWKNWVHFLGIDTSLFIQSKTEWKNFCRNKKIKTTDEYKKACNIYPELPKNPNEFYNGFSNLFYELRN